MGSMRSLVKRVQDLPWRSVAKEGIERSFLLAKFLCFCHVTNNYICSIALVCGPSMLPTLNLTGDLVLVERISPRINRVGHGDIVLVRSPENPRKTITKRITGMEGDSVTFAYDSRQYDRWKTIIVPKGHVWVQGDNVFASNDSRNFGPVPYALVQGKALMRWINKLHMDPTIHAGILFMDCSCATACSPTVHTHCLCTTFMCTLYFVDTKLKLNRIEEEGKKRGVKERKRGGKGDSFLLENE